MTSASSSFSITITPPLGPPDYLVLSGPADSFTMRRLADGQTFSGTKLNCRNIGVAPGEVIQFEAGAHGERCLVDVIGTPAKPIVVRSDPDGQVVIRRAAAQSAAFVFALDGFRHAILDGSTTAGMAHGFKIMHAAAGIDAPSAFLKVGDSTYTTANQIPSSFFTLRAVDIDGGWPASASNGIGISINDHESLTYSGNQTGGVPTLYRERILIERCRVRNTEGEGMYVGPNWRNTTPTYQPPNNDADDLPLRDVEIRHNEIDNSSWDLCNCKSWIAGDNRIHHNVMRNGSQALYPGQQGGITANNCHVKIYNNWVEKTGNPGIQTYMYQMPASLPFGPFEAIVYNNVVVDLFTIPGDQEAKGINAGGDAGSHEIKATIYNNTVVGTPGAGIATSSAGAAAGGVIANNLVVDGAPIAGGSATLTSNLQLSLAAAGFVDGANQDFHLTASSPARNQAQGPHVAATDYLDHARPMGSAGDIGAYEYDE